MVLAVVLLSEDTDNMEEIIYIFIYIGINSNLTTACLQYTIINTYICISARFFILTCHINYSTVTDSTVACKYTYGFRHIVGISIAINTISCIIYIYLHKFSTSFVQHQCQHKRLSTSFYQNFENT